MIKVKIKFYEVTLFHKQDSKDTTSGIETLLVMGATSARSAKDAVKNELGGLNKDTLIVDVKRVTDIVDIKDGEFITDSVIRCREQKNIHYSYAVIADDEATEDAVEQ